MIKAKLRRFSYFCKIPTSFLLIAFLSAQAIAQENRTKFALTESEQRLFKQLIIFTKVGEFKNTTQRVFFAREAAAAGVRNIRPMTDAEKPKKLTGNQTGCGGATNSRDIIIDTSRRKCVYMGNLAHEIAHISAFKQRCYGHGDRFYQINYQIAKRFEMQFPRIRWGRNRPTRDVLKRASEYHDGGVRCPGKISITGE